ncbi:(+)-delta-cadinene synthase isozyme A-like [Chenopodium quinoa]|nr:(+)-delta-cadinene synthase isozyme A-like [Chenopodium quinoa]
MEIYAKEIEPLKEDLRKKLLIMDDSVDLGKKMSFIDAVERLGVSYHFESEIEDMLNKIFKEFAANNFDIDYDLHNTACQFRIFRQHGHKMPCDVFNKFTNSDGKFKENLRNDIKAIVSLYESALLRVYGEPILDEAFAFATDVLKLSAPYSELARHALKQVLHFGIQRVENRLFISFDEEDETRHETLLKLAKIDFNRVQLLYRKELSQVLRWWYELDFKTKLPYARQRMVFIGCIYNRDSVPEFEVDSLSMKVYNNTEKSVTADLNFTVTLKNKDEDLLSFDQMQVSLEYHQNDEIMSSTSLDAFLLDEKQRQIQFGMLINAHYLRNETVDSIYRDNVLRFGLKAQGHYVRPRDHYFDKCEIKLV